MSQECVGMCQGCVGMCQGCVGMSQGFDPSLLCVAMQCMAACTCVGLLIACKGDLFCWPCKCSQDKLLVFVKSFMFTLIKNKGAWFKCKAPALVRGVTIKKRRRFF
jgi:hypothetical protein